MHSRSYFLRKAAAIAVAPRTSSTKASEYKGLNLNRYQAPPMAIMNNPAPNKLKALGAYFCGFEPRIAAKTSIQQPESTRTTGTINVQSIRPAAKSSMATTTMMRTTPRESISLLLSLVRKRLLRRTCDRTQDRTSSQQESICHSWGKSSLQQKAA